jgi:superfamily II helicase
MKKCSMCFQEKPILDFYNNSSKKDGKQTFCKDCYKSYYKNWVEVRKESPQTEFPQSKTCTECHVERPISQFGKRSAAKDKKMSVCKDCWRIVTRNALARHFQKGVRTNGIS